MKEKIKETYDRIAQEYYNLRTKKYPEGWFYNELLEMPTTLKLLGKINNKKILDLGCGPGLYVKILAKKGAIVKGIDISEKEIEIARINNPNVEFKIGNAEKLPYKDKEFDIVLAALVIEHFNNWDKILNEIKRVLKNKGVFVFSIGNPVANCLRLKKKKLKISRNYFEEGMQKSMWWKKVHMIWYHKTYGTVVKLLVKHGFVLEDYEDCKPVKKAQKLFPKDYEKAIKIPYFCSWKWRKS